jgi:bacteriocin biosynthesis cyclodehydratase domain-containing protein
VSESEHRGGRPAGGRRVGDLEGHLSSPGLPAPFAGGPRYRLHASVEPVVGADGTLYLVRAGGDDLVVREALPADRRLVRLLAGGAHTRSELAAALALSEAGVDDKLAALGRAGVVHVASDAAMLDAADEERYARQLPYFAELGDERELQRRLAGARIVVVGCGGLGTWVVAGLAAAGVRRLRLVDDDEVELSNLNRQVLYTPADIGAAKVHALAAWLRAFDDRVEVEPQALRIDGPGRAAAAVDGADALVLAADTPPYVLARWINRACVARAVPFITAGQLPPMVKVGPLYWPGLTACFACHESSLRRDSLDYDAYVRAARSASSRATTLGPASGIIGSAVAMELVHALAGAMPASAGASLMLDLRTMRMQRRPIARDSACPECQHAG